MNLKLFIVTNLFIQLVSTNHLTIFRNQPVNSNIRNGYSWHKFRKLLCVSDRPRDAIVWNTHLDWNDNDLENSDRKELEDSKLSRFTNSYEQQSRLDVDGKGFYLWGQEGGNWSFVNSHDVSMGPVYDSRWEHFKDVASSLSFKPIKTVKNGVPINVTLGAMGSFVFSIRGRRNFHILMCESENYQSDFCYWIIIGGWLNKLSGIRKCKDGVPWLFPPTTSSCHDLQNEYQHTPLSSNEWKTFVLTWEEKTRTIELFDPDKKILSYSDTDSTNRKVNNSYHIFYRSPSSNVLFRYHGYNYTLTTDRGAILRSSPLILGESPDICVDMLVGLCSYCNLLVSIIDGSGKRQVTRRIQRSLKHDSIEHGLPMWQYERIQTKNISHYPTPITLELVASVISEEADTIKDHWAITKFENCLPEGIVKSVGMTASQDYHLGFIWPSVTCQRLSYDDPKSDIVEANIVTLTNLNNFKICKNYNIGPHCALKCKSFFDPVCSGVQVCTKIGCSCMQGYSGFDCTTACSSGSYGYGCSKQCNNCSYTSCDRYTGKCSMGCKTFERFHIPPYCDDVIEPPSSPLVDEIKEISARVSLHEEENYKFINATFEFEAGNDAGGILKEDAQTLKTISNGTEKNTYYATFNELLPGTKYAVKAIIQVQFENNKYRQIVGSPAFFMTLCNWSKQFKITPSEKSLLIEKISEEENYPCPDSWYSIDLSIISSTTNESRPVNMSDAEIKFPITLLYLHSLTEYQVCINGSDMEFRDCQILSTLEAAPQPVENLQEKSISATEAEITWSSSESPNGIILGYNLTVKVLNYIGCQNKEKTPENLKTTKVYSQIPPTTEVSYKLRNLVPYVLYEVSVSAYNSRVGNKSSFTFSTEPRDIPTEVFSNVNFSKNEITWDDPVDCWTITGPIDGSRVVITGVSESVKNFYFSFDTKTRYINLNSLQKQDIHGNEKYRAEIYVLRQPGKFINTSARVFFTTNPSPPPKVQNLEIVEIDESSTTLRWQQPLPPINGELDYYSIRFLGRNERILSKVKVYLNETCYLWKNSFCKTVPHPLRTTKHFIEVRAYNKGINSSGESFQIIDDREEQAPEKSEIISAKEIEKGVVYLKWRHPSITGGPMTSFIIDFNKIDTELENYPSSKSTDTKIVPIRKYEPEYSTYLYLQPSTRYTISIKGKTAKQIGKQSQQTIETACTLDFQYAPYPTVDNDTSLIKIIIPPIVNNTKDSKIHIIVKGPSVCKQGGTLPEQMLKDIRAEYHEVAWRVATIRGSRTENSSFVIGNDHIYDGVSNCPLKVGNSYAIVILVREKTHLNTNRRAKALFWQSKPIRIGQIIMIHHESWAIPLILILLIIGGAMYFFLLKKRNKKHFNKKKCDEIAEPIPIYPIVSEKKVQEPEYVYEVEDARSMVDIREEIPITPSNSTERLNRAIATESIYENVTSSSMIGINYFQDYVKEAIATGKLDLQYEILRRGQTKPWKYGTMPQNKSKNRYANLIAYDDTRVILEKLPDEPYSDYINANYIPGYNNDKAYIATQGPKPNTLIDFWRMVWQEDVLAICMLANIIEGGKTKCEQYWPDIGKEMKYGKITVGNVSHTVFADYSFRIFHVTFKNKCRKIRQLHFTAWADHGVPLYTQSVVSYLKKLLATPTGNGPILVHCSAGVGRTGTIILCDICLRRAAGEGIIDVFGETEVMRNQRANMVDNKQQYLLAHLVLVECLLALPTSIPCNDNLPSNIQEFKNQLVLQQQRLEESTWRDRALQSSTVLPTLSETNLAKNRFPELAPLGSRIYISRYPTSEDDSNYITGVYVDSARHKNNNIASQLPLPNTVGDFWRMVAELKIELIILLQPIDPNDETCDKFIPKPDEEMKPVPFITLKGKSIVDSKIYIQQKVILINSLEKCGSERSITILTCKDWKPGKNKPPPKPTILVDLWLSAERISRSEEPTLVLCYDGVTGCGLYLALSFLLERMGLERECDVCLAIRAIRRSRPDFCKSIDQFEYLYDAAAVYSDYFETYANFT